jgi:hypothetical protein
VEAEAIVARGVDAVPELLDALRSDAHEIATTAMLLLAAIGDRSAMEPILDRAIELEPYVLGYDETEHGYTALQSFGADVVPAVRRRLLPFASDKNARDLTLLDILWNLTEFVGEAIPAAAEVLLEVMRTFASRDLRGHAALILISADHREAAREIEDARRAGRLGGDFEDLEFETWLADESHGPRILPRTDPLDVFLSPHRAAFHAYRAHFEAKCGFPDRFTAEEFSADLRTVVKPRATTRLRAGRNDACPCGSGKKYKKCCLGADETETRPHPAWAHIPYVRWSHRGFAMLPSEQFATLPEQTVADHFEILRMDRQEVRKRLQREADDYAMWACALRLFQLGDLAGSRETAVLIAASDRTNPALDYVGIEAHAVSLFDTRNPDALLSILIRLGRLTAAWNVAGERYGQTAEERFGRIWDAWPRVLWTPVALAESGRSRDLVTPLERALAMAERGESEGHPGPLGVNADAQMRAPCPVDVIRGYLEDAREDAKIWARIDATRARYDARPLPRLVLHEVEKWRHDLVLAQLASTEDGMREDEVAAIRAKAGALLDQVLREGAPPDSSARAVVVSLDALDNGVTRVIAVGDDVGAPAASAALLELAAELAPEGCGFEEHPWGQWRAAICDLDLITHDALHDFLDLVLEEALLFPVRFDARALLDTAPASVQDILAKSGEEQAQLEPPAPVAETGMSVPDYVRRIIIRLVRMSKIGAAHTDGGHFFRGVPKSVRGDIKRIYDTMVLERYIRVKPTVTSDHISLEPGRLAVLLNWVDEGLRPPGRLGELLEAYEPMEATALPSARAH